MELFKIERKRQMSDSLMTAAFLVLSGGYQDAYTYFCRGEVFANAQTGNIIFMSASLFKGEWLVCAKYLIPVVSFLLGTFIAESIQYHFKFIKKIHWRQIILLCEIIILFSVGFIPQWLNAAANALVSFVCALQVQTFHKVHGHVYASTMCIGNMRSATQALHTYFRCRDIEALRKAFIYFGVIFIFALGAGIGSIVTVIFKEKSIWISCALLLISFLAMFIRRHEQK